MALKGDTSNLLLADIFQTLSQNGQQGLLCLKGSETRHLICFARQGITLFDARVFDSRRLAHLMATGQVAPPEQVHAALKGMDAQHRGAFSSIPFLAELAERGLVSRRRGLEILRNEVREELLEVFSIPRMEFEFDDDEVPPEGIPNQCFFRTEELIMDAARRLDEGELIRQKLGSAQQFYVVRPGAKLDDADPEIVGLLDGSHTTLDISERLLRSRFEVSRTVSELLKDDCLRPASADELIRAARQLDPEENRPRILRILQHARSQLKLSDSRLDDIGELFVQIQARTSAISILLVRARTLLAEGQDEAAHTLVQRARDLDPNHLGVLQTLAEIHRVRDEKDLEAAALTTLAERCAAEDKYDDAVEFAARVAQLDPDSLLLDHSFADYCQRAGAQKRGADVLSEAAGLRTAKGRVAALYDAILLLDPSRGDIRRAIARQANQARHLRLIIIAAGTVLAAGLFFLGWTLIGYVEGQRLVGRLDSAEQLLARGEARLIEAELLSILSALPEGQLRERADQLLSEARSVLTEDEQQRQHDREQELQKELTRVQYQIDAGQYGQALQRLLELHQADQVDKDSKDSLAAKQRLLEVRLEAERVRLLRLASQFREPESDSALLEARDTFGEPFSKDRIAALEGLLAVLETADGPGFPEQVLASLGRLAEESLETLRQVQPGLESIERRIARNAELDLLSEDFQEIRQAEEEGRYDLALRGYDRLIQDYGDGPLQNVFGERRRAVRAILDAVRKATGLLDQGDSQGAYECIQACDRQWPNLAVSHSVGLPIQIQTVPAGAAVRAGGRSLGAAPTVLWAKAGAPTLVSVTAPGFETRELALTTASGPTREVELQRSAVFRIALHKVIDVTPTVAGGKILVGARDGIVYRLDLRDGRRLDQLATSSLSGIGSPPQIVDDLLILALGEGELRAQELDSLEPRWSLPLGAPLAGPPARRKGSLLVATTSGRILEVNTRSGRGRLVAELKGTIRRGPVLLGDRLAVGLTDGSVVVLSREDGLRLFATLPDSQPIVGLVSAAGLLISADDGGTLRAISPEDGALVWERKTEHSTSAPLSAHDDLLVFASGKEAYVLDAKDGTVRVKVAATAWVAGTPGLAGGRLYVGDLSGILSAFDVNSGALLFRHHMEGVPRASPLVLPEGVLLTSDVGVVTLIGA